MPPKDIATADLLQLEKFVTENASGFEKLATLNQGMQILLVDRQSGVRIGAHASVAERSTTADSRATVADPMIAPPPSPQLPSPRNTTGPRLQAPMPATIPPYSLMQPYKAPKVDFQHSIAPEFGDGCRRSSDFFGASNALGAKGVVGITIIPRKS